VSIPAAGWYQDPGNAAAQRWWDGVQWTQHTQGHMPPPPPQNPYPQMSPYAMAPVIETTTGATTTRLQRTNPLGFTGAVVALVSLLFNPFSIFSIVAIVFSIIGIVKDSQLRRMGRRASGLGWVIAGLVMGCVSTFWYLERAIAAANQAVGAG